GLLRFIGFTHRVSVPNSFKSAPALKKSATSRLQLPDLGLTQFVADATRMPPGAATACERVRARAAANAMTFGIGEFWSRLFPF
ncbi:MAG: hypothetical protein KGL43_03970, partial [Burkholderiales bacterium]|nr:hypothetical protein [Burkholderiales bacterium]